MRSLVSILIAPWLLGAVLASAPSGARACAGDCGGDGAVSIGDLIVAINISLGEAEVTTCTAVDTNADGVVAINELIAAVSNGLRGCPATPTPSQTSPPTLTPVPSSTPTFTTSATPTSTATASLTPSSTATPSLTPTSTPSPTPTRTVVFPDVSGLWGEGSLGLASSTCIEVFATALAAELARRPPCPHQLSSAGPIATVVDCTERAFVGALDAQGFVTYVRPDEVGSEGGCVVRLSSSVLVPAAISPTTATYFFDIQFSGTCPLDSCELTATALWTRQSPF